MCVRIWCVVLVLHRLSLVVVSTRGRVWSTLQRNEANFIPVKMSAHW